MWNIGFMKRRMNYIDLPKNFISLLIILVYENFVATKSAMIPYTTPNAISVKPSVRLLSIMGIIAIVRLIIAPSNAPLITG